MSVFPTLDRINKQVEKVIFGFIWNGRDRIKRKTLIGDTGKGGISMPDFILQSYGLKAAWLSRLLERKELVSWSFLPYYYLNSLGENALVLKMSLIKRRMIWNNSNNFHYFIVNVSWHGKHVISFLSLSFRKRYKTTVVVGKCPYQTQQVVFPVEALGLF